MTYKRAEYASGHNKSSWLQLLASVAVWFLGIGAVWATDDPNFEKGDPMAHPPTRRALAPNHEALVAFPLPSQKPQGDFSQVYFDLYKTQTGSQLAYEKNLKTRPANGLLQIAAAAGRIVSPASDQVVYAYRNNASLAIEFPEYPNSTEILSSLPPLATPLGGANTPDAFDVAVGDLDVQPDANGSAHDEVVACYASGSGSAVTVQVAVLDFTSAQYAGASIASLHKTIIQLPAVIDRGAFNASPYEFDAFQAGKIVAIDSPVSCAIGDFNGDGMNDIAVAYLKAARALEVVLLHYTHGSEVAQIGLTVANSSTVTIPPPDNASVFLANVDLAAGDFDGDGDDDLAVAAASWKDVVDLEMTAHVSLLSYKGNSTLERRTAYSALEQISLDDNGPTSEYLGPLRRMRAQIAAGLFQFDPATGFGISRRQLALVYPSGHAGRFGIPFDDLNVEILKITDNGQFSRLASTWLHRNSRESSTPFGSNPGGLSRFSLAAGRFIRFDATSPGANPQWSLLVSYLTAEARAGRSAEAGVSQLQLSGNNLQVRKLSEEVLYTFGPDYVRLPLVAYDRNGDSLLLESTPVHFTISDLIQPYAIIQEPPKHIAYLDPARTITNISRNDDFYVSVIDEKSSVNKTESKTSVSGTVGVSEKTSSQSSITVGGGIGLVKASGTLSGSFSVEASRSLSEYQEDYRSHEIKTNFSDEKKTIRDDYIVAKEQDFDVWRYRVYGLSSGNNEKNHVFYDVVIPRAVHDVSGAGQRFDWYQPEHENGNILSYPRPQGKAYRPADLGSFTLANGVAKTTPLFSDQQLAFDGTAQTISLEFSEESGAGSTRSFTKTLGYNSDASIGAEVKVKVPGVKTSTSLTHSIALSDSISWGNANTSEQKVSQSRKVILQKPAGNNIQGYAFSPIVYLTKDGVFKVAHTVDPTVSVGRAFWAEHYGTKPDPALSLPRRFEHLNGNWTATQSSERKRMRGFFLREATRNAATGEFDLLSANPTVGDSVRLETRIYNYSLGEAARNLTVRFAAIPYNPKVNKEEGERQIIGETTIAELKEREMKVVAIEWSTGISCKPGATLPYHIYVTLDPENIIDELYEGTTDPWQNNEGFSEVTLSCPSTSNTQLALSSEGTATASAANEQTETEDIFLPESAITIIDATTEEELTGAVRVHVGQRLSLRVHVQSTQADPRFFQVVLYDQFTSSDPTIPSNRTVVADKIVQGIDAENGAYEWIEWTPEAPGVHELRARILGAADDIESADNQASVTVEVIP